MMGIDFFPQPSCFHRIRLENGKQIKPLLSVEMFRVTWYLRKTLGYLLQYAIWEFQGTVESKGRKESDMTGADSRFFYCKMKTSVKKTKMYGLTNYYKAGTE